MSKFDWKSRNITVNLTFKKWCRRRVRFVVENLRRRWFPAAKMMSSHSHILRWDDFYKSYYSTIWEMHATFRFSESSATHNLLSGLMALININVCACRRRAVKASVCVSRTETWQTGQNSKVNVQCNAVRIDGANIVAVKNWIMALIISCGSNLLGYRILNCA